MNILKITLKQIAIELIKIYMIQYLELEQTCIEDTTIIIEFIKNRISA